MIRTLLVSLIACLAFALPAGAQRKINPVTNPNTVTTGKNLSERPDTLDRTNLREMTDANGRVILVDTVSGREVVDSAAIPKLPPMINPLWFRASVYLDLWDPIARVLGTHHGLFRVGAELNLHNRYIPVVEFGLGNASYTPEDNNFTYRSSVAPFFKLGINYNFLYNSNPDYMAYAGLRFGFSSFNYTIADVTIDSPYWREDEALTFPRQHSTASYLELMFGIRVRIVSNFSLGWAIGYHAVMHTTPNKLGKPWYIPGYGVRTNPMSVSFSLTYTFDLQRGKKHSRTNLGIEGDPTTVPHLHPGEIISDIQQEAAEQTQEDDPDSSSTFTLP